MASTLITTGIVGALLLAGTAGTTITLSQTQVDQLQEAAFMTNATTDIQNCKLELAADAAFTGGVHTQNSASAAVSDCVVSAGTVLSVRMHPNARDFTITATNAGAPSYTVVSDTAAGGSIQTIEKGA
jgi:predicted RNA-binding protein with EMAP domain